MVIIVTKETDISSRAAFHQSHQQQAEAEALRLWAQRDVLQGRWFDWVAQELYQLSPPPFANMVRRELQKLSGN